MGSGDAFDPYHQWLGIPKGKRPPTYYQLLGISPSETDRSVIETAADRQRDFVRKFRGGEHDDLAVDVLVQIDDACLTLLDPETRQKYDTTHRARSRQRRKTRRPQVASRSSHTAGESSGLVRSYLGIVSIILAGFIIMAAVAFWLYPSVTDTQNNAGDVANADAPNGAANGVDNPAADDAEHGGLDQIASGAADGADVKKAADIGLNVGGNRQPDAVDDAKPSESPSAAVKESASKPTRVASIVRDDRVNLALFSNGRMGSPNSKSTWHVQDRVLVMVYPSRDAPFGKWVDTCFLDGAGSAYQGENQNGVKIKGHVGDVTNGWVSRHLAAPLPDSDPSEVVARIEHRAPNGKVGKLALLASGRVNSVAGQRKWILVDDILLLIFPQQTTYVDTCKIRADLSIVGKNQSGQSISGRVTETTPLWDQLRQ